MITFRLRPSRRDLVALAVVLGSATVLAPGIAAAQDYPTRPITLIVPYAPGASNDLFSRAVAEPMGKVLGQPVVVDNRAGAGGFVGASFVSRSEPDGYMLLQHQVGIASTGPGQKVDFDASRDLTPIGMIARSPSAFLVPASLGVNTLQEFIDYAKANPETTFYATTGIGTTAQIHNELFNKIAGITTKPVVYTSAAHGTTDLIAGRVQLQLVTVASAMGPIEAGQLKVLAYTGPGALPDSPKAPTAAEAGVTGFESLIWWGLWGPPNMPADIVNKLNSALNEALKDPAVIAVLNKSGATPAPTTPEEFGKVVSDEIATVSDLIRSGVVKFD